MPSIKKAEGVSFIACTDRAAGTGSAKSPAPS
jgi:hypothetical protein